MDPIWLRFYLGVAVAFFVYVVSPLIWPHYRDMMRVSFFHRGERITMVRDAKGRRRWVTEREFYESYASDEAEEKGDDP